MPSDDDPPSPARGAANVKQRVLLGPLGEGRKSRGLALRCGFGEDNWMRVDATALRRLNDDLDQGLALPTEWYTDAEVCALEMQRIFRRTWQYVGRTEQVGRTGDYFTTTVADIPVIAVRAVKDICVLVNVCRHRRHEVASGAGNLRSLQCPYHAWTYELDGRLRSAPRSEWEPVFCMEDYPLLALPVATWGPWIFANADPSAMPFAEVLGDLPRILAGSGLDIDSLELRRREEWTSNANWKVMIENYLECYHCPIQHPAFSAVIDVRTDTYKLEPHRWFSTQRAPVRDSLSGKELPYNPEGQVLEAQYHLLWPNFTLSAPSRKCRGRLSRHGQLYGVDVE